MSEPKGNMWNCPPAADPLADLPEPEGLVERLRNDAEVLKEDVQLFVCAAHYAPHEKIRQRCVQEMLEAANALEAAQRRIESLEALRPLWAAGHSSDSVAAQVQSVALAQLWKILGASSQTEAVLALESTQQENERLREAINRYQVGHHPGCAVSVDAIGQCNCGWLGLSEALKHSDTP